MFCYRCQEAAKGTGCSISGVYRKKGDVANVLVQNFGIGRITEVEKDMEIFMETV